MIPTAVVALLGLVQGPWLHSWAVAAGRDETFSFGLACPRGSRHESSGVRCSCGRPRWREFVTALGVGGVYWAMAATLGVNLLLVAHLAMVSLTSMLIITDLDHFRIPNRLLYPGGILCIVLLSGAALLENAAPSLLGALLGAVLYSGLLFLVFLVAKGEGFGFGDVKLAVLLGFFAGFHTLPVLAYALFITSLIGGIPALVLLLMGKSRRLAIPYGPPLILGTWAAIVWAPSLLA